MDLPEGLPGLINVFHYFCGKDEIQTVIHKGEISEVLVAHAEIGFSSGKARHVFGCGQGELIAEVLVKRAPVRIVEDMDMF